MTAIQVEVGDGGHPRMVSFKGRWLVAPDPDGTRTSKEGYDAGAYYGVALTESGRIAVYTAHSNGGWGPTLTDYDSLPEAADDDVPTDILAMAAYELRQDFPDELEI